MYPIHEIAGIVAMANEKEQAALTEDIRKNGQREPAVLWRGFIVDGRCRQLACNTLNIELLVRELDDKLTIEEVSKVVKSLNTRRNLTMTQKVVSAYKQQVRTSETNLEVATQWAISVMTLKNCKYIAKYKPEYIEPLFNGNSIVLFDSQGRKVTTNKINTIAKLIKITNESVVRVVTPEEQELVEFNVEAQLKYEEHKNYFYDKVKLFTESPLMQKYLYETTLKDLINTRQLLEDIINGQNVST